MFEHVPRRPDEITHMYNDKGQWKAANFILIAPRTRKRVPLALGGFWYGPKHPSPVWVEELTSHAIMQYLAQGWTVIDRRPLKPQGA